MTIGKFLAIAAIATVSGFGTAQAQSLGDKQTPAEFPPADFKSKQYVDSRGCVYIRAGVDGATTWVPRVTRDRKVICGFKPTFDTATRPTTAAPKLDADVVQIQPAAPPSTQPSLFGNARPTPAPSSAPAPKTVTTAPAATVVSPAPRAVQAAPKPTQTVRAPAAAATVVTIAPAKSEQTTATGATGQKAKTVVPTQTRVKNAAPAAQPKTVRKVRDSGIVSPCREGVTQYKGSKVRCGPQTQSPVTPGVGGPVSAPPVMNFEKSSALARPPVGTVVRIGEVAPDVRVVPKHVYEARLTQQVTSAVPKGYRRAFDDGRLDTQRAVMTFAGQEQMQQIWTQTVPMRLIPQTIETEAAAATAKSVTRVKTGERVRVSTKAEAPTKALRLAGTPYVQVATLPDAEQAQVAAQRIRKLGVPVRIGRYERNGTVQRIVLAGPFGSSSEANAALRKAQEAGFSSAFLRK